MKVHRAHRRLVDGTLLKRGGRVKGFRAEHNRVRTSSMRMHLLFCRRCCMGPQPRKARLQDDKLGEIFLERERYSASNAAGGIYQLRKGSACPAEALNMSTGVRAGPLIQR